jgi:hypothetical protein
MKVFDFAQYSPEHWAMRRGRPTASRFGDLITAVRGDPSKSADAYINDLIAQIYDDSYGNVDDYVTAAMRNGTIMEPAARRFYEFERDVEVTQVGFCLSDCGRYGGSPDGLADGGVLELKCPTLKTQVQYLRAGGLPVEYRAQCHGHLIVTGLPWCDFLSYAHGLPPLLVRVEPDEYTEKLRDCLAKFLDDYQRERARIAAMFPPPPPPVVHDYGTLGTVETSPTAQESYF